MKNPVSGLLMETVVSYNKLRLHKVGYFGELTSTNENISQAVRPLLDLSRGMIRRSGKLEYDLVSSLERDPLLKGRLRRLRTVPGVGSITALTASREPPSAACSARKNWSQALYQKASSDQPPNPHKINSRIDEIHLCRNLYLLLQDTTERSTSGSCSKDFSSLGRFP